MTEKNNNQQPARPTYSALEYDPEMFRAYVSDLGITRSQQDALLESVWLVVLGILDAGLKAHQEGKPLAADSSAVIASLKTSANLQDEDARAGERQSARRMDS